MIAVIFESKPRHDRKQTYLEMGAALNDRLKDLDGFISIERFQSVVDPGKLVAISYWRDRDSVDAWRNSSIHRNIQASSRANVFEDYTLVVAEVVRKYGMFDREQAPEDSRTAHAEGRAES